MKRILIIFTFIFFSCSINDDQVTYEEKLVLWANLRSNFPLIDTVFVAKSASLNEQVSSKDLWVNEAQVYIIGDTVNLALMPVVDSPGRYFTNSNYIFQGGMTYKVEAVFENDTISGVTTIPQKMEIISEPQTIYTCKNSTYDVPQININNYDFVTTYYTNVKKRNFFRRWFTRVYTPFLNFIFRLDLPYYNGLTVYKTVLLQNLKINTDSFTFQIEIVFVIFIIFSKTNVFYVCLNWKKVPKKL